MAEKNLKQLLESNPKLVIYRVYEEDSDIPLFYCAELDSASFWYENLSHNKIVIKENFSKLYLIPNYKENRENEPEPTINFTFEKLNRLGIWSKLCIWKGWESNMTLEKVDSQEEVKIPLSIATKWKII